MSMPASEVQKDINKKRNALKKAEFINEILDTYHEDNGYSSLSQQAQAAAVRMIKTEYAVVVRHYENLRTEEGGDEKDNEGGFTHVINKRSKGYKAAKAVAAKYKSNSKTTGAIMVGVQQDATLKVFWNTSGTFGKAPHILPCIRNLREALNLNTKKQSKCAEEVIMASNSEIRFVASTAFYIEDGWVYLKPACGWRGKGKFNGCQGYLKKYDIYEVHWR